MAKILLTKRRLDQDDLNMNHLSIRNSQNQREPTLIGNNNNHVNSKKQTNQTEKAPHVVIFRKISSLRNKINNNNNNNNNQLDKRHNQLLKNNFTSLTYLKNSNHRIEQHQHDTAIPINENEEECLEPPMIITSSIHTPHTPHQSLNKEFKNNVKSKQHECLFCKYERVISSDNLPNFARKRINEIFEQLTNPEKYEKKQDMQKKISANNKSLNNKNTRSHGSFHGSSSYLTTSQILDY